jgi:DNA-binding NarL/FixJ family response regulator
MIARVKKRLTIVLVDENPLTPEGVVGLVRAEPGFRVLTTSAKIEVVTRTVRQTGPDLVLLNLARQGHDRLRLAGALHGAAPEFPVIVMGLGPRWEDVEGLVRAGVSGFIMANASLAVYLSTIRLVAHGIRVLPPDLTHALFVQLGGHSIRRSRRWPRPVKGRTSLARTRSRLEVGTLSTPVRRRSSAFESLN